MCEVGGSMGPGGKGTLTEPNTKRSEEWTPPADCLSKDLMVTSPLFRVSTSV